MSAELQQQPERIEPTASSAPAAPPSAGAGPILEHEYDGIQEYDNPLPGWWLFLFWAAIAFAPAYVAYYHFGQGLSVAEEYAADVRAFEEAAAQRALEGGTIDEGALTALATDAATVGAGEALYRNNCAACHGDQGEGRIGPNLTDEYWIHGGSLMQIFTTIDQGVPEKGMLAWGKTLAPDDVRRLTAFVASRRGKNVPGLAPQGDKWDGKLEAE